MLWCRSVKNSGCVHTQIPDATTLGSLSRDVFERRTSTGSGRFELLNRDFEQIFGQIVSIRITTFSNTNTVASRQIKRERGSLPVDVRRSKPSQLKLPKNTGQGVCSHARTVVAAQFLWRSEAAPCRSLKWIVTCWIGVHTIPVAFRSATKSCPVYCEHSFTYWLHTGLVNTLQESLESTSSVKG